MSDYTPDYELGENYLVYEHKSFSGPKTEAGLKNFEVDTDTLEDAARTLDTLADYAEDQVLATMKDNLDLGAAGGGDGSVTQIIFGKFDASHEVTAKYNAHYQAAVGSTDALVKSLRDTAEKTRKLVKDYRSAEEANKATADQINKILEGDGSTGASAGYGYPSTGTYNAASYPSAPAADQSEKGF